MTKRTSSTSKWTEISSSLLSDSDLRIEASFYNIDALKYRNLLQESKYELRTLTGPKGIASAYHRTRFKRIFVKFSDFPIYQPGQIIENSPKPAAYISERTPTNIDALRVHKGQVLLTCSGTIGNLALVEETFDNQVFSHDLIRITANSPEHEGYIYAYLKSSIGHKILLTNNYGAVVSHIEPPHLDSVPIPLLEKEYIKRIGSNMKEVFILRDQANNLMDQSDQVLYSLLNLPAIDYAQVKYYSSQFTNKAWEINKFGFEIRLDASFYNPVTEVVQNNLKALGLKIVNLEDEEVTEKIFMPGRFKRTYIEKRRGIPFLSGKNIIQSGSDGVKFLAKRKESEACIIQTNWILVTRSGTIGRTALVTNQWNNWAATEHIIRAIPSSINPGYLLAYLNSEYGQIQLNHFVHGSVVDEITVEQLGHVKIPVPPKEIQDSIGEPVQKAFEYRAKANNLEEKTIRFLEEKIGII